MGLCRRSHSRWPSRTSSSAGIRVSSNGFLGFSLVPFQSMFQNLSQASIVYLSLDGVNPSHRRRRERH
jgi:hypothetical protein